jgi:hypothetical protein
VAHVPSSKGLVPVRRFCLRQADTRPVATNNNHRDRFEIRPFDITMVPVWHGGTLSLLARLGFPMRFFSFLLLPNPSYPRIHHLMLYVWTPTTSADSAHPLSRLVLHFDTRYTSSSLQIHVDLRALHSFAMHFATFAGSDYEALEPIVKLEQAKRAMEIVMGIADSREVTMRERGWCLWAIGGWKVGWVSSLSVRPLWCILTRRLRARNFHNDNVRLRYSRYTPFASYSMLTRRGC